MFVNCVEHLVRIDKKANLILRLKNTLFNKFSTQEKQIQSLILNMQSTGCSLPTLSRKTYSCSSYAQCFHKVLVKVKMEIMQAIQGRRGKEPLGPFPCSCLKTT